MVAEFWFGSGILAYVLLIPTQWLFLLAVDLTVYHGVCPRQIWKETTSVDWVAAPNGQRIFKLLGLISMGWLSLISIFLLFCAAIGVFISTFLTWKGLFLKDTKPFWNLRK